MTQNEKFLKVAPQPLAAFGQCVCVSPVRYDFEFLITFPLTKKMSIKNHQKTV